MVFTPESATASGFKVESPVKKTPDSGQAAAKTAKPILERSSLGMCALSATTPITDMIRKARGHGCGINNAKINVNTKIEIIMPFHERTNLIINEYAIRSPKPESRTAPAIK